MGTSVRVTIPAPRGRGEALEASEAAFREVERMESLLSSWRRDTPLSELNHSEPGHPHPMDTELRLLLERALSWVGRTGGAFEPRVGALVDAWDLRGSGRIPTPEELDAALQAVGPRGMTLEDTGLIRHHSSAWLDAGGFGKGTALANVADTLMGRQVSAALVDLGGQLLALGAPEDEPRGWTLQVAHPEDRSLGVAALRVRDVSVATSGVSERGIRVDERRFGHILDPRTGRPAPIWGSVTVVSPDPMEADVLATALYVMGPDAGLAYARGLSDVGTLFLVSGPDGVEARWNTAMERWLVAPLPAATVDHPGPLDSESDP